MLGLDLIFGLFLGQQLLDDGAVLFAGRLSQALPIELDVFPVNEVFHQAGPPRALESTTSIAA